MKQTKLTIKNIQKIYKETQNPNISKQLRYYYKKQYQKLESRIRIKEFELIKNSQKFATKDITKLPALSKLLDKYKYEFYSNTSSSNIVSLELVNRLRDVKSANIVVSKLTKYTMDEFARNLADKDAKLFRKPTLNKFERMIIDDWDSEQWEVYWEQYYSHFIDESAL